MAGETRKAEGVLPSLRRASAAADAEWVEVSAALASDLLAIQDPGERAIAYAALSAKLGATGDGLLPADEARVRTSFGPAPPLLRQTDQQHDQEFAAWLTRDAASQAEIRRLARLHRWVPWGLVPAATLAPAAVAAAAYGWGLARLVSVVPSLPSLPLAATGGMCVALLGAGLCAVLAAHAKQAAWAWGAAGVAFAAGVVLLISARALPVHIGGGGVAAGNGQSLAGVVVMVQPTATGARLEVLSGNGMFRRGDLLDYSGSDPAQFLSGR